VSISARVADSSTFTPATGTSSVQGDSLPSLIEIAVPSSGSDRVAPVTPFGATIPAPAKKSGNATVVLGVAAAAALVLVIGFVATRTPPKPDANATSAGQAHELLPVPPRVEAPPATATVDPQKPVVEAPSASVVPPPVAARRPASGNLARPAPQAATAGSAAGVKPAAPKPAGAKPGGSKNGFVPPPMSDPGF
jgi:hypothetical protein